ncbi:hypothetical protein ZHAS_00011450 [Anopheles sinensis]|uniref:Gustatory receptor n=1 Tax=Anopheles sinensis TaxID=74873 RepID=A0A084W0H3_ANOSI|nr:hypothetical protein ZHAS_00011450 [Anopheles sinensis]
MNTALLVFLGFYTILRTVSFPDLNLVRYLVYVELFIRYATIATSFYQILINEKKLYYNANQFILVAHQLSVDQYQTKSFGKVYLLGFKVFCIDVSLCILFTINNVSHIEESFQKYRTINAYVVLVSAQVTNIVLLVLVLGAHGYSEVIDQLDRTVNQLRCFEFNCSYWRKRKASRQRLCCDASDSIDRLNTLHNAITEVVQSVLEVLQIPILLTNLNQFVVILSRARKPGLVLNAYINAHLDVRTEQSMDIFGLALLTTESKVIIVGMYTMDLLFLYSLAATATTYLLVLVQFQLNMP